MSLRGTPSETPAARCPSSGRTEVLEGGGTGGANRYLRVSRTSAAALSGTATVDSSEVVNNEHGLDNVSSAEAAAGDNGSVSLFRSTIVTMNSDLTFAACFLMALGGMIAACDQHPRTVPDAASAVRVSSLAVTAPGPGNTPGTESPPAPRKSRPTLAMTLSVEPGPVVVGKPVRILSRVDSKVDREVVIGCGPQYFRLSRLDEGEWQPSLGDAEGLPPFRFSIFRRPVSVMPAGWKPVTDEDKRKDKLRRVELDREEVVTFLRPGTYRIESSWTYDATPEERKPDEQLDEIQTNDLVIQVVAG